MNDPYEPPDETGLTGAWDFMEDPHEKHLKMDSPGKPKPPLDDRLISDWDTLELIHEKDTLAPPWERHNPEGGRYEELMDELERSIESNRQERDSRIAHPLEPLDINFPEPEQSIIGGPRNSDPPSPIEPLTSPTRGPNPPGSRRPVLKTRSGAFGGSGRFRPRVKKFNFKSKYVPGLEKYRCPDGRSIVRWVDDCRNCDHYRSTSTVSLSSIIVPR